MLVIQRTIPLLLAQESVAVEGQLGYLAERLLSPSGIATAAVLMCLLILVFVIRKPLPIIGGAVLALSTFVLPKEVFINQLIGPLQSLRFLSKSIAFALLGLIVFLALPGLSRGGRLRSAGFAATVFFFFQMMYTVQFALFAGDGALKGSIGVVAILFMFLSFGVGFGRLMQDRDSAVSSMEVFAWVGVAFSVANLLQIAFGLSGALVGGRLAGIAGNAQMMGGISACLILANAFLYTELPSSRPLRWVSLALVGVLSVLLLATGSRTALLSIGIGLLVMFRLQVGRLAVLAVVAMVAYLVVSLFLEDPAAAVSERLASGQDTRTGIWLRSLERFLRSPIFGELIFLRPGDSPSGVESTLFRTLANMGIVGGIVLLLIAAAAANYARKGLFLAREHPEFRRLVDFYLGACMAILILNLFDGYAFGFLTFPALFMYLVFTVGSFLADQAESGVASEGEEVGLPLAGY